VQAMGKAYLVNKLMFFIWYYDRPDILKWDGLDCTVKVGPLARALVTTNYRLKDYFVRLEQLGVITNLKATYGSVSFTAVIPKPIIKAVMVSTAFPDKESA
jgi:hypothetical protein